MGILEGKRLLVSGVLVESCIGLLVARIAQEGVAEVVLSSFGKALRLTTAISGRLPRRAPVVELDVTDTAHLDALAGSLREHVDGLDGVVHAIGYAPQSALGGRSLETPWDDLATALHTSAYSLKSLTMAAAPLFGDRASVVGLDFDATVAWPQYDWLGVAKAAFESTARYLARDLGPRGVRVNLVSAGPLETLAASGIPGFDELADSWRRQAPLGWDVKDPKPVAAAALFLLSGMASGITGEIVHVDGGYHAMGAPVRA